MFRAVCYRHDECQIIATGTDRKIGYWETYDGSQIRELDGSKSASIYGMDIYGKHFVTGGGDKLIRVCVVMSQKEHSFVKDHGHTQLYYSYSQ